MSTTTHIVGLAATIRGRVIQRCAFCGEKLLDSGKALQETMMRLQPGQMPIFVAYEPGRLLQIHSGDGVDSKHVLLDEGTSLPDDSCESLVEA